MVLDLFDAAISEAEVKGTHMCTTSGGSPHTVHHCLMLLQRRNTVSGKGSLTRYALLCRHGRICERCFFQARATFETERGRDIINKAVNELMELRYGRLVRELLLLC